MLSFRTLLSFPVLHPSSRSSDNSLPWTIALLFFCFWTVSIVWTDPDCFRCFVCFRVLPSLFSFDILLIYLFSTNK